MNKKIAVKLALISLITLSTGSNAAVDIDISTASIGIAPQNTINISNISYGGAKFDATLQWNLITANFDITSVALSSANPNKCSLGKLMIGSNGTDITLTLDPLARTITIAYTPTTTYYSYSYNIDQQWDLSIIQSQTQLYTTTDSGLLSSNTALLTRQPDPTSGAIVAWNSVPGGASRYAKVTQIPIWFNFSLPISSVFDSNSYSSRTYICL